jgi:ATP-dependent Clp protease ATP-binding subunit ClpC
VLDEGHLTDNYGRKIDFKNTVVIMTSNVGARRITGKSGLGFQKPDSKTRMESIKQRVAEEIEKTFNPEFLNRLDEVIVFHPLDREQIKSIVDILAREIVKRLEERDLKLVLTDEAKGFLADKGFNEKFGARPLKRALQRYLEDPLSESILEGNFARGLVITIGVDGETLRFTAGEREEETVGEVS